MFLEHNGQILRVDSNDTDPKGSGKNNCVLALKFCYDVIFGCRRSRGDFSPRSYFRERGDFFLLLTTFREVSNEETFLRLFSIDEFH